MEAAHDLAVRAYSDGDLEGLYRTMSKRLEQAVRRGIRAPDGVIEDACQFAWSRLIHRRAGVCDETALGWLITTAVHEAFKLIRRGERDVSLDLVVEQGIEPPACAPGPAQIYEMRERLAAVGALRQRERRIVWLRALGLSWEEIARREQCTTRTVQRQLERARRAVRAATAER